MANNVIHINPLAWEGFVVDPVEDLIKDNCITLEAINRKIADLQEDKAKVEGRLKDLLKHDLIGSKTYKQGHYAITVTTGINYTVNGEEYELLRDHIPECFNAVKRKIAYSVDRDIIRDIKAYGSEDDLKLYKKYVKESDAKLSVKLSIKG